MKANRVWALLSLPLVVAVTITACGKQNSSKDNKEAAANSQRLGSDPCGNGLIDGPQGSEPVPVLPVDGQPGYQPVPPSPGPGGQIPPSTAGNPNMPPPPVGPGNALPPTPGKPDCTPPLPPVAGGPGVIVPGKPGINPGQMPNQGNCGTGCVPPPAPGGNGKPFPPPPPQAQMPAGDCGKPGVVCFPNGNPAQLPSQGMGGHPVNQGDAQACLGALHQRGHAPNGAWGMQVETIRAVNVLGRNSYADTSRGARIVLLEATSVLGSTEFMLANPQALYCIKSVSVLDRVRIGSCWSNNVVVISGVNVLSNVAVVPLLCN